MAARLSPTNPSLGRFVWGEGDVQFYPELPKPRRRLLEPDEPEEAEGGFARRMQRIRGGVNGYRIEDAIGDAGEGA